eukprot:244854-Amphidinium_carterae.1
MAAAGGQAPQDSHLRSERVEKATYTTWQLPTSAATACSRATTSKSARLAANSLQYHLLCRTSAKD